MNSFFRTITSVITAFTLIIAVSFPTNGQDAIIENDSFPEEINRQNLRQAIIAGSVLSLGTLGGLYFAWYKDHPRSSFHFHDDLHDWLQMDKGGHMVSSYYLGALGYQALRRAGLNNEKAAWFGGSFGSIYLLTIEVQDGFSAAWGASVSDLAANTLGSAAFIAQQLAWQEQRVKLKFSYHPTLFPSYRPDVLGSNHIDRILKDYNGITYWISLNPASFGAKWFPAWLNVAAGYGATGLTGGSENISGWYKGRYIPEYERTRQFFLSLDIDLSRIETQSTTWNSIFRALNVIKVPFPALEYGSNKKFRFYPLYF